MKLLRRLTMRVGFRMLDRGSGEGWMRGAVWLVVTLGMAGMACGQAPAVAVPAPVAPSPGVIYRADATLEMLAKKLLEEARTAPSGNVSVTLDKYPTHFTMLSARVKSGVGELHKKASDLFVVMDGEATVITGGTMVDPKETGDEVRGTRVEGGTAQVMRKGDVIMIPPNTPHQTTLEAGKTFTYFVVKVVAP